MTEATRGERVELLRRQPLFAKLGNTEIAELVKRARVERYLAGDEIFGVGSPGDSMLAVLRGSVKITSRSFDGRQILLNKIGAGEVFGEIALLDGRARTGDATALTDCELMVLHRREFLPFLQRRPDVTIILLEVLCERLRNTTEQVGDVMFVSLSSRLAKCLIGLVDPGENNNSATVHVTQQQLADMVGSARESVNRQLQAWQKDGLIAVGKGSLTILDKRKMAG